MSENSSQIKTISNYDELFENLASIEVYLKNKSNETKKMRYFFRRVPLYFGSGLIFFVLAWLISLSKEVGYLEMSAFLNKWALLSASSSWFLFSLSCIGSLFLIFSSKDMINNVLKKLPKYEHLVNFILFLFLLSTFLLITNSQYPLLFGVTVFPTVVVSAMLVERTLGYTRRNERYQLFANRAKGLLLIFKSKEKMGIEFNVSYLNEIAKFYEALRLTKYTDTINDTHYLLSQIEKRIKK